MHGEGSGMCEDGCYASDGSVPYCDSPDCSGCHECGGGHADDMHGNCEDGCYGSDGSVYCQDETWCSGCPGCGGGHDMHGKCDDWCYNSEGEGPWCDDYPDNCGGCDECRGGHDMHGKCEDWCYGSDGSVYCHEGDWCGGCHECGGGYDMHGNCEDWCYGSDGQVACHYTDNCGGCDECRGGHDMHGGEHGDDMHGTYCSPQAGHGIGGTKEFLGDTPSIQACADYVAQHRPSANAATWGQAYYYCYAEFGQTGRSYSAALTNCYIGGGEHGDDMHGNCEDWCYGSYGQVACHYT